MKCHYEAYRGENHYWWRGGDLVYGEEFTDILKEVIRDEYDRKCYLCDMTESENNRKLDVHHINYNKKDARRINLLAFCWKCHTKTNYNRWYWFTSLKDNWITNHIDFNSNFNF